jgi:hypothetical protein
MFKKLLMNRETGWLQAVEKLLTKASGGIDTTRKVVVIVQNRHCSLREESSSHCP